MALRYERRHWQQANADERQLGQAREGFGEEVRQIACLRPVGQRRQGIGYVQRQEVQARANKAKPHSWRIRWIERSEEAHRRFARTEKEPEQRQKARPAMLPDHKT